MIRSSIRILAVLLLVVCGWGIVMPHFGGHGQARRAAALEDISRLTTAIRIFGVDCGRYPTTAEGLISLMKRPATLAEGVQWRGPYWDRDVLPKNHWGKPYVYQYPGKHNLDAFDIFTTVRNAEGGKEVIGNWPPPSR